MQLKRQRIGVTDSPFICESYKNSSWNSLAIFDKSYNFKIVYSIKRGVWQCSWNLQWTFIKWGCDSSQQMRYKQKFTSDGQSDENLFNIFVISIQLHFKLGGSKRTLWQNPSLCSVRYCRLKKRQISYC